VVADHRPTVGVADVEVAERAPVGELECQVEPIVTAVRRHEPAPYRCPTGAVGERPTLLVVPAGYDRRGPTTTGARASSAPLHAAADPERTMALSTTHRLAIYTALAPIVGEEPTDAMLAQFPSSDRDEPLTRDYLDLRLADLRTELKGEMAGLRTELKGEMAGLRTELKGEMAELRTEVKVDLADLRTELKGEIKALETRLTVRFLVFLGLAIATARFVLPAP
jgi:ribosomal protein L29